MKPSACVLMSEQRFDFPAQNLVARTRFFQERGALALLTLQGGVIDLLNLSPTFGRHRPVLSSQFSVLLADFGPERVERFADFRDALIKVRALATIQLRQGAFYSEN